ncbi:MAG: tripartite tricarboxylate transporter substrate binding protein [Noviherbaspirillum sp.]
MDAMARVVAENASKQLGQPIVVENRPGAGNTMAAIAMKSAEPNGYTLGLVSCATLKLPHVAKTQYDPLEDLTYISRISEFVLVLAVRADSPYQKVEDLVKESSKSGLFYGTAGKYNSPHLAALRLANASGANWTNAPFKGDADAIMGLLAGDVQFVASSNSVLPFIHSGKVRALGVFGAKRSPGELANVPTLTEQGYPVVDACPFGIMGPKGLDPAIVKKLDAALKEAINAPGTHAAAQKFGFVPDYLDANGFDKWARQTFEQDREMFLKLGKNPE